MEDSPEALMILINRSEERKETNETHNTSNDEFMSGQVTVTKQTPKEPQKVWTCPVCLEYKPAEVLVPCGHSVCFFCEKKLHDVRCPVCRRLYRDKVRNYDLTPDMPPGAYFDPLTDERKYSAVVDAFEKSIIVYNSFWEDLSQQVIERITKNLEQYVEDETKGGGNIIWTNFSMTELAKMFETKKEMQTEIAIKLGKLVSSIGRYLDHYLQIRPRDIRWTWTNENETSPSMGNEDQDIEVTYTFDGPRKRRYVPDFLDENDEFDRKAKSKSDSKAETPNITGASIGIKIR